MPQNLSSLFLTLLARSLATLKTSRHGRCSALARDSLVGSAALDGYELGAASLTLRVSDAVMSWRGAFSVLCDPPPPPKPAPYLLELLQAQSSGGGMFVLSGNDRVQREVRCLR